jgi:hypothetical protein
VFNLLKILLLVIGVGTSVVYCGTWGRYAIAWTTNQMMEFAIDAQKHQMSYSWFDRQLSKSSHHKR